MSEGLTLRERWTQNQDIWQVAVAVEQLRMLFGLGWFANESEEEQLRLELILDAFSDTKMYVETQYAESYPDKADGIAAEIDANLATLYTFYNNERSKLGVNQDTISSALHLFAQKLCVEWVKQSKRMKQQRGADRAQG